jgi:hypothetical protein
MKNCILNCDIISEYVQVVWCINMSCIENKIHYNRKYFNLQLSGCHFCRHGIKFNQKQLISYM